MVVEPRDAATMLLVRDGSSGIEVFMVRRNPRSVFVAGAHVFPGGALEPADAADDVRALVDGIDDVRASRLLGRADAIAFWVAAIRECFEEAGVLLARDRHTRVPVAPDAAASLGHARAGVAAGRTSFACLLADADLVLDGRALRPIARWITPEGAPRRYDTWFFAAPAPVDQTYLHDDDEAVASEWLAVDDALARGRSGAVALIYPTFRTLQAVGRFRSCDELFAALDGAWRDPETALRQVRTESPTRGGGAWQVRFPHDDEQDELAAEREARQHSVTGRPR